jgi:hypothetical protein
MPDARMRRGAAPRVKNRRFRGHAGDWDCPQKSARQAPARHQPGLTRNSLRRKVVAEVPWAEISFALLATIRRHFRADASPHRTACPGPGPRTPNPQHLQDHGTPVRDRTLRLVTQP